MDFMDMKKLSDMLNPKVDSSDSEDDLPRTPLVQLCKSKSGKDVNIVTKEIMKNDQVNKSEKIVELKTEEEIAKDIWHDEDIVAVPEALDVKADTRSRPEYEVKYKQYVGTEDAIFGMGVKTPLTSSCEAMVIDVKLPGEQLSDICTDVKEDSVDVRSPKYRLHVPFPHEVHKQMSKASWNSTTCTLTVTVFLNRELDFANF